jgi:regulatory protein
VEDDRRDRAIERAATMLAHRSHGRAEVERKLARSVDAAVAADVVDALERAGLVDDAAHARELAARRLAQGWGPLRIEHDLAVAAIDHATIRAALEGLDAAAIAAGAQIAVGRRTGADALRRLATRGFDEGAAEAIGVRLDTGQD